MYELLEHHETAEVELYPTDRPGAADKGTPTDILGSTHGGSEIPAVDLTDTELSPHRFSQAKELLSEFSDVFSQNDRDYGRANLITHSIKTENTSPIRKTPYRLPQAYREAGEKQIQEMFEDDLIEPSTSPWYAPVVMARKKMAPCASVQISEVSMPPLLLMLIRSLRWTIQLIN